MYSFILQQQAPAGTTATDEAHSDVHDGVADDVADSAQGSQPRMQTLRNRLHAAAFVREFQQWLQRTSRAPAAVSVRDIQTDLDSWAQYCSVQHNSAGAELARYSKNRVARVAKREHLLLVSSRKST
jgi:hypothetical protein